MASKLKVAELKTRLTAVGLDTKGVKVDLVARLEAHERAVDEKQKVTDDAKGKEVVSSNVDNTISLIDEYDLLPYWWGENDEMLAAVISIPFFAPKEKLFQSDIVALLSSVTDNHLDDIASMSDYAAALLADKIVRELIYRQRIEKWEENADSANQPVFGSWGNDVRSFHISYYLAKTSKPFEFSAVAYRTPQEAEEVATTIYGGYGFLEIPLSRSGKAVTEVFVALVGKDIVVSLERPLDKIANIKVIKTAELLRSGDLVLIHHLQDDVVDLEKKKLTIVAQ